MNCYVTGGIIKRLREDKRMTQADLADRLCVSDKTISKWETAKGYPDITLLEPLAQNLGVSVIELMSGDEIVNKNRSFNMKKVMFYICPVCGNIIVSTGETVVCCCGINLLPSEAEMPDEEHLPMIETVEDEYYVSFPHEMTKKHYISFIAAVRDNGVEIVKLYPEGAIEARFNIGRILSLYAYCNRHGLFKLDIPKSKSRTGIS